MVVWAYGSIYASEYSVSSGTWSAETTIESGSYSAFSPHIASNGTGYCTVWRQGNGTNTIIYANLYDDSTWGTETTVSSATESAYSLRVASNGTGYL